MASRICSVAFNEQAWDTLHQLMGKWPDKSRNAVINHIINTYETEQADLEWKVDHLEKMLDGLRKDLDRAMPNWQKEIHRDIYR